jgi:polar amino acid transport system substrate-binding protein
VPPNADVEVMEFSPPYMEIEQGYLVRAGVPIVTASDVDKIGIRVGVIEKAGADLFLSRTFKNAVLVRAKTVKELYALLDGEEAHLIAATKTTLFGGAERRPGSRVLDGRILVEPIGIGVPKGRDPAAASYVGKFGEAAKAEGLVNSAIERAALRGAIVAPVK